MPHYFRFIPKIMGIFLHLPHLKLTSKTNPAGNLANTH